MDTKGLIGLLAGGGLALYFYKQNQQAQEDFETRLNEANKEHEAFVAQLLYDKEALEDIVNPSGNVDQAPVTITAAMTQGGVTLNQTEIILTCTNNSGYSVELGDFQLIIWICGNKSLKCMPSNINSIKIPARKTVSFRLYAREGIVIQDYVNVKKQLNELARGESSSFMKANTSIPLSKEPVVMNMQYLWLSKAGEKECFAYDIPCSYLWKSAGWTHGSNAGYNAAKEKEQDKNPSNWEDMREIDE